MPAMLLTPLSLRSAATSYFAILLAIAGCNPGQHVERKCLIDVHTNWPSHGEWFVRKPSECPVFIPAPSYAVDFYEVGGFNRNTLGNVRVTFYNANDEGASSTTSWYRVNLPPYSRDSLEVVGTYQAGTAGFVGSQTDRAVNDIEVEGIRRFATIMLKYQRLEAVTVAGPIEVNSDEAFTLDADLHVANAVPPLAWAWYVNGILNGSSEFLNWTGGNPGAIQQFEVRVTEGNGAQWTATHAVSTRECMPVPPAILCDP